MQLLTLGLPLLQPESGRTRSNTRNPKFPQPCAAFDGCRCRIYAQRPRHCHAFECLLLKSVKAGQTKKDAALEIIRTAKKRADKVWRLLRELGDFDEEVALS